MSDKKPIEQTVRQRERAAKEARVAKALRDNLRRRKVATKKTKTNKNSD